jgi:hypothetical protein
VLVLVLAVALFLGRGRGEPAYGKHANEARTDERPPGASDRQGARERIKAIGIHNR